MTLARRSIEPTRLDKLAALEDGTADSGRP